MVVPRKPGSVGIGGLIYDYAGVWLCGFMGSLGECTSLEAELRAILAGLQMAWSKSIPRIQIESDSQLAINLICGDDDDHPLAAIIHDCQSLMTRDWNCSIRHTLREGNSCADFLAERGEDQSECIMQLEHPPWS